MLSVQSAPRFIPPSLFLLILPLLAAGAEPSTELERSWTALANTRPQDVLRLIDNARTARPERLARAAALMTMQPSSDDQLRKAETVLEDLAKGDDEAAAQAAYLQARLHQVHYQKPDYAQAAALFLDLATRQPESHWAQLGLVKFGMMKLYVLPDSTAEGADRLAPAEVVLAKIREPLLQRDLHMQIGQAGVVLHQPLERFLPHLVEADRIGGITGQAHEDLIVQLGILSLRAGKIAAAKVYFERYLEEFPTNVRAFTARAKLAECERLLAAGKGGP